MGTPLAYLLTWTCFGTWLPGDARGSFDRGRGLAPPCELREEINRFRMASNALVFTSAERRCVQVAIREHCAHRGWWLGACNVRTNHLHCVVAAPGRSPELAMKHLKTWSTRALRRRDNARFAHRVWTRHGSTRYLWSRDDVAGAMQYVLEAQDDPRRWERSQPRSGERGPGDGAH
ncbi:MAG: transposase [Phycisphaerales bacterium]